MKLSYSQKKGDKTHFFIMEGDLIGDEVGPALVEMVTDSLDEGIRTVVIDLAKVRYISSSGLGLLITLHSKIRNVEGELILTAPSEHVKKLLLITKLHSVFQVLDSLADVKTS